VPAFVSAVKDSELPILETAKDLAAAAAAAAVAAVAVAVAVAVGEILGEDSHSAFPEVLLDEVAGFGYFAFGYAYSPRSYPVPYELRTWDSGLPAKANAAAYLPWCAAYLAR
jgi:hypothetical protein